MPLVLKWIGTWLQICTWLMQNKVLLEVFEQAKDMSRIGLLKVNYAAGIEYISGAGYGMSYCTGPVKS